MKTLTDDLVRRLLEAQRIKKMIVWVSRDEITIAQCYDGIIHGAMATRRRYTAAEASELLDRMGVYDPAENL